MQRVVSNPKRLNEGTHVHVLVVKTDSQSALGLMHPRMNDGRSVEPADDESYDLELELS